MNLKEKFKRMQKQVEMPSYDPKYVDWGEAGIDGLFPPELTLKIERRDIWGATNSRLWPIRPPHILGDERRRAIEEINSGKGMTLPVILHEYQWGVDEPVAARLYSGVQAISLYGEASDRRSYEALGRESDYRIPFYFVHFIKSAEFHSQEWKIDAADESVTVEKGERKLTFNESIWDIDYDGSLRVKFKQTNNFYRARLDSEHTPFLRRMEEEAARWFNVKDRMYGTHVEGNPSTNDEEIRLWRESPRDYDVPQPEVTHGRMPYSVQHLSIDLQAIGFVENCRRKGFVID